MLLMSEERNPDSLDWTKVEDGGWISPSIWQSRASSIQVSSMFDVSSMLILKCAQVHGIVFLFFSRIHAKLVCRHDFVLHGRLQGSWRMNSGLSDALTLKQHQKELFFWALTPDAGSSGDNRNGPMQAVVQGYVTSDLDEGKGLSINNTLSMVGIDAQAPPALYRICESRLYRANVEDSSSIEFSFQVTTVSRHREESHA